ncbi:MAG: 4Fe-4S dicluster domain-containing protein [Nannocystaceae bacterium]|nr:4Fe-4S dicluster domain-containing protein [Nannocystaceae bacterium]
MSEKHISYQPTEGLSYDPAEPKYWDRQALDQEITRVFEVCHGCRMCFKYCDSFPSLFSMLDNKYDGDVRQLTEADTDKVMAQCFQCKLCEVQCPYTPRDGHEFKLDFPKLVHRWAAQRHRKHGPTFRDRVLGNPDLAGAAARASLGLANVLNRVRAHRVFMEKVLGVHRDKQLPDFAFRTFEHWATKQGLTEPGPGGEAVLFQTCYVQHNEPQVGRDTVEVMQRNKVDIRCAKGFVCCGMPAWEHGDLEGLRKNARKNLDILVPYVEQGAKVLAINPTCSMMLRREYPQLVAPEDRERATMVAEAVADPSEYLWSLRKQERFNTDFASSPKGAVAYHAPCHLRTQGVGFKGRDLLRKIPGVKPRLVMECCGHDGTFAMKTEGFVPSQKVGKRAFDGMKEVEAEVWATDCPLAAVQFEQHAGVKPLHPMSLLARAYRGDSFDKKALPAADPANADSPNDTKDSQE